MRITTRGRYALRASIALAVLGKSGGPISISAISEQERISPVYLEQIFFKLRRAGIVDSVRGPGGGFYFAVPLETLSIRTILDAAGEKLNMDLCDKHAEDCSRLASCLTHPIMAELIRRANSFFEDITLASILEKPHQKAVD
jgi:Rrf2 family iron-sulfur cluster assembly transcriptional regulator